MKKLLDLFVSQDDYRPWMEKPFHAGKYDGATDSYTLIGIEQDEGYDDVAVSSGSEVTKITILSYLDQENNKSERISIEELKKAVEFSTEYAKVPVEDECDECDGVGKVEYEYSYKLYTSYTMGECPKCEGTGVIEVPGTVVTEELIGVMSKCVNIGVCYYHGHILNKLLQAAILLGEDHVTLVAQSESTKGTKFMVGKAIVIVMPIRYDGDAEVYYLGGT